MTDFMCKDPVNSPEKEYVAGEQPIGLEVGFREIGVPFREKFTGNPEQFSAFARVIATAVMT
jgi:hypothetical protein